MKSLLFTALLALCACAGAPDGPTPDQAAAQPVKDSTMTAEPAPAAENTIRGTGQMQFQDLEGGFWGIVADDGRKLDPLNLDARFHKEGLRVRFEAQLETDRMSTRMWGSLVTLKSIEIEK